MTRTTLVLVQASMLTQQQKSGRSTTTCTHTLPRYSCCLLIEVDVPQVSHLIHKYPTSDTGILSQELPELVSGLFPVDGERRSITGHSMGGHGALICHLKVGILSFSNFLKEDSFILKKLHTLTDLPSQESRHVLLCLCVLSNLQPHRGSLGREGGLLHLKRIFLFTNY